MTDLVDRLRGLVADARERGHLHFHDRPELADAFALGVIEWELRMIADEMARREVAA